MRKISIIIIAFTVTLISFNPAAAWWEDYSDWWGGLYGNGCRGNYTQSTCKPPSLPPGQGKSLSCTFYYSTDACCCEGLVWVPDSPTNINISAQGNTINMDWNADPATDRYELWWSTSPVIHRGKDNKKAFTGNSFSHTNLKYDTKYYYTIDVVGTYGRSNFYFNKTTETDPNPPQNTAPQINAGTDRDIEWPNNTLTLYGSVSDDGLPNPPGNVTISWSLFSGPGQVQFSNPQSLTTSVTLPMNMGTYIFRISADDGQYVSTDDVSIGFGLPTSGDWIISSDFTLNQNYTATANVEVSNGAVLTIPDGVTLDIDMANHNLTVREGSGVLIRQGGKID
jgi:hypothetical protein